MMNKELISWFAWAVVIVVVALVARHFRDLGHIDPETTKRVVIGLNGLFLVWIGNRLPKAFAPNAWIQQVKRFGGWSMVLSGLIYVGLWAFAPIAVAKVVGSVAVIGGIVVTVIYCLMLRSRVRVASAPDAAP